MVHRALVTIALAGLLIVDAAEGATPRSLVADARAAEGAAARVTLQCANTTSAAIWHIKIDYGNRTVDSFPAKITETEISWHDTSNPGGGYYYLDRGSGDLKMVVASSTGGYELHHRCSPE